MSSPSQIPCRFEHQMSKAEIIARYLRRQSRVWLFIQALALMIAIGLIDYLTGAEVTVDPFYSIPILLMVWFGNKYLAIVISVFCALAWCGRIRLPVTRIHPNGLGFGTQSLG